MSMTYTRKDLPDNRQDSFACLDMSSKSSKKEYISGEDHVDSLHIPSHLFDHLYIGVENIFILSHFSPLCY